MGKALSGKLSCPCDRSCLACHYKCTGRAVALPLSLVLVEVLASALAIALAAASAFRVATVRKKYLENEIFPSQGKVMEF